MILETILSNLLYSNSILYVLNRSSSIKNIINNHLTITFAIKGPKNIHPTVVNATIINPHMMYLQTLLYKSGP